MKNDWEKEINDILSKLARGVEVEIINGIDVRRTKEGQRCYLVEDVTRLLELLEQQHKAEMREAIEEAWKEGWSERGKTVDGKSRSIISILEMTLNQKESFKKLFKKYGVDEADN